MATESITRRIGYVFSLCWWTRCIAVASAGSVVAFASAVFADPRVLSENTSVSSESPAAPRSRDAAGSLFDAHFWAGALGKGRDDVARRVGCSDAYEIVTVTEGSCEGFECALEIGPDERPVAARACFSENELWRLLLSPSSGRYADGVCQWSSLARTHLSRALGEGRCVGDNETALLSCEWRASEAARVKLVRRVDRDDPSAECTEHLYYEEPEEAGRRAMQWFAALKNDACGARKSAEELRTIAARLDLSLIATEAKLKSYRPRLRSLVTRLKQPETGVDPLDDFPLLSPEDSLDLGASPITVSTDAAFYERKIAGRLSEIDRKRRCLAHVTGAQGPPPAECARVLCSDKYGWRDSQCLYSVSVLNEKGRRERQYNVDDPDLDDRADIDGCTIAMSIGDADQRPGRLVFAEPVFTYLTEEQPRTLTEFANKCSTIGGPKEAALKRAHSEFPQDPWLSAWNRVTGELRAHCAKTAQRRCESVYRIRDMWAIQYQTKGCELRKAAKTDIQRDIERARGILTDAQLAEHEELIDVLDACAEFNKAGFMWKFREPTLRGTCAPKGSTKRSSPARERRI